jgi:HK97 family phage prohead protease
MPIVDGREYRSFELAMQSVEEEPSYIVEGYATTFNESYPIGNGYYERIDAHAIDGADMSDVIFLLNHGGMVFARLRNKTLFLSIDTHGLKVRADIRGCQQGRELAEGIKNGLIDRMSWSFKVAPDGWEYDPLTKTSTITKIEKIYDVSAVSIPANDGTEIHSRSYLDGVIESERKEFAQREEMKERARIATALELY